jgi:hypothetical protein
VGKSELVGGGEMMKCPMCGTELLEHPANRCLDARVAEKVMGYRWYKNSKQDNFSFLLSDKKAKSNNEGIRPNYPLNGFYKGWDNDKLVLDQSPKNWNKDFPSIPPFSTDISAAWEVLFQLRKNDKYWSPTIKWNDDDGDSEGWWEVQIDYFGDGERDYKFLEANAITNEEIPLAICRAALLAVAEAI